MSSHEFTGLNLAFSDISPSTRFPLNNSFRSPVDLAVPVLLLTIICGISPLRIFKLTEIRLTFSSSLSITARALTLNSRSFIFPLSEERLISALKKPEESRSRLISPSTCKVFAFSENRPSRIEDPESSILRL